MLGGDSVEWFGASFPGAPPVEVVDGIRIVRAGEQATVHWQAFRRYRRELTQRFDVVIDEVNTIPFFTPLWAGIPTFMFIHQLAREVWWYESRFPINALGYLAEPWYLRIYRKTPVLTVSESTRRDLLELKYRGPITVLPEGLEPMVPPVAARADTPTFLYVGRLSPSKRIGHLIDAFSQFTTTAGEGQLWLVGDGRDDYVASLKRRINRAGLGGRVLLLGRLTTSEKHERMAQAHALLMTSVREGWGLVVIEANACGTPAIVYGVPGLRDAVRNEITGLVVTPSSAGLAQAMLRLWRERDFSEQLAQHAKQWAAEFSFDVTAARFREAIQRGSRGGVAARSDPLSISPNP